ncbi:MAG: OmpA family protein [Saprospirales bacterium]|nr:OmpA family protein [Saprospirales bacterium]
MKATDFQCILRLPFAGFFLFCTSILAAQTGGAKRENLVLNPSFETLRAGESIEYSNALTICDSWDSPNAAEPLLFTTINDVVYDPNGSLWPFKARTGKNVAGINIYGSRREYIQGALQRPLTVGKKYYFSFFVHYHCEGANNIGIVFLPEKLKADASGRLNLKPASFQRDVTPYNNTDKMWTLVRDSFIAYQAFQSFIIGNFAADEETTVESERFQHYFAYIDDIVVTESAEAPVAVSSSDQAEVRKWTENVATAKDQGKLLGALPSSSPLTEQQILFQFDNSNLQEESLGILDEIAAALKDKPDAVLRITGYASSEGSTAYNLRLSQRRAHAVRRYLVKNGVGKDQIRVEAKGEAAPLAPNDSEENRKQNRRVTLSLE